MHRFFYSKPQNEPAPPTYYGLVNQFPKLKNEKKLATIDLEF